MLDTNKNVPIEETSCDEVYGQVGQRLFEATEVFGKKDFNPSRKCFNIVDFPQNAISCLPSPTKRVLTHI